MKLTWLIGGLLLLANLAEAQFLTGTYQLIGQREMAAEFKFMPDSTFDFFYSYGAVDRHAKGSYSVIGNQVKLKSQKEPGKDFRIKKQLKKGKGYTIIISDSNKFLINQVLCVALVNEKKHNFLSDTKGQIFIELAKVEKMYLQHSLFPDILSLIKDETNQNNYFEVALLPSLAEVSFKGVDLTIDGNMLTCLPNYFMPMTGIQFERSGP